MTHIPPFSRRFWLIAVCAAAVVQPLTAQAQSLNGVYRAEGRNPDGSTYTGRAVLAELNGAVQINWTVGNQTYAGSGTRQGQVIVINWGSSYPIIYVVMADGALHGTWEDGTALEKLVRQ